MNGEPIQKWLQAVGVGSRNEVRLMLTQGRVTINGEVTRRFAQPVGVGAQVAVDGQPVVPGHERVVYLMNKPIKHLTTIEDQEHGPGLGRYLPEGAPRVFPVGRLDFNTQGALLWTNDGLLARRILHPDWSLPKRYGIKIRGHLSPDDPGLARMRAGMTVGKATYRPAVVEMGPQRTRATWIYVTITEGKNRQLRRMCAACNYQIVKLRREAVGPVALGELNKPCVRRLEDHEVEALEAALFASRPQQAEEALVDEAQEAAGVVVSD